MVRQAEPTLVLALYGSHTEASQEVIISSGALLCFLIDYLTQDGLHASLVPDHRWLQVDLLWIVNVVAEDAGVGGGLFLGFENRRIDWRAVYSCSVLIFWEDPWIRNDVHAVSLRHCNLVACQSFL